MNCDHVQSRLSAYLDAEVPVAEGVRIRAHLDTCPRCAAEFAELCTVKEGLTSLEPFEPSPELEVKLLGAVRRESRAPLWKLLSITGISAALLFAGQYWYQSTRTVEVQATLAESVDMRRDQAALSASDPLSAPAPVYLIGNDR